MLEWRYTLRPGGCLGGLVQRTLMLWGWLSSMYLIYIYTDRGQENAEDGCPSLSIGGRPKAKATPCLLTDAEARKHGYRAGASWVMPEGRQLTTGLCQCVHSHTIIAARNLGGY